MMLSILLIGFSVCLSAFCSGVETGLYRVPRVRLVLDSLEGSRIARGLIWLANHPGLYVSTLLLGNNVANYCITLGISWIVIAAYGYDDPWVNIVASLLTTPLLFIYCELLPKSLFHLMPHRLLKWMGGPLLVLTFLALPVTWLLYLVSKRLERILGEEPLTMKPALARRELRQVLQDGEEAGLLLSVQRDLAQNLFAYGGQPISNYCMPLRGFRVVDLETQLDELQRIVINSGQSILPVVDSRHKRLVGYYQADDIRHATSPIRLRAAATFAANASNIEVLQGLVARGCLLGRIVDPKGQIVGVVLRSRLISQLLQRT